MVFAVLILAQFGELFIYLIPSVPLSFKGKGEEKEREACASLKLSVGVVG